MAGQTSNLLSTMNHTKQENISNQGYIACCNSWRNGNKQEEKKKKTTAGLGMYIMSVREDSDFFKAQNKSYAIFK